MSKITEEIKEFVMGETEEENKASEAPKSIFETIEEGLQVLNVYSGCILKTNSNLVFIPGNHYRDGKIDKM